MAEGDELISCGSAGAIDTEPAVSWEAAAPGVGLPEPVAEGDRIETTGSTDGLEAAVASCRDVGTTPGEFVCEGCCCWVAGCGLNCWWGEGKLDWMVGLLMMMFISCDVGIGAASGGRMVVEETAPALLLLGCCGCICMLLGSVAPCWCWCEAGLDTGPWFRSARFVIVWG